MFDSNENIQVIFELITSVDNEELLNEFKLYQNYPNPFNPTTLISYSLKESSNTKITIVNILGKVVDELVNEFKLKGSHQINYNASHLTSGVYFIRIEAGNFTDTKKMVLNK